MRSISHWCITLVTILENVVLNFLVDVKHQNKMIKDPCYMDNSKVRYLSLTLSQEDPTYSWMPLSSTKTK